MMSQDGNEEYVTGTWRKSDFFKKVWAENLMDLCLIIWWKVELVSDNHGF